MSGLEQLSPHLYLFRDTCNVYVLVDGDAALLIDAGSGAVLDHLPAIGVSRVEWILQTHHHRDQCWGTHRLLAAGAHLAVPEYERHLFEQAEDFWQTKRIYSNYNDRNTFFTVDRNLPVAAVLADYETFSWRGHSFYVLPAKGHTGGSSALIVEVDGQRIAFTGDLMAAGGKLYQLHAMEYTYGDLVGAAFTLQSLRALRQQRVQVAYPSHGDVITAPAADIERLERRLLRLLDLGARIKAGDRAYVPESRMTNLSEHLLWGGPMTYSNFYVVKSDSGKALFIDYGHSLWAHSHDGWDREDMETPRFIEHHLDDLRDNHGITSFDTVLVTHIHDDHTVGVPFLQRHHGTQCWALDTVATVLEAPAAWSSTPCILPKPIRVDRRLQDGERFTWEEFAFEIFFAPGQTEYHSVIAAQIDGKKVAFVGDNIFMADVAVHAQKREPRLTVPTVLRNSFQLWMHQRCAEVLKQIQPDLICPGHQDVIRADRVAIAEHCDWIAQKEQVFRELVAEPADHYIDLFWVRMLPYQHTAQPGEPVTYTLLVRNNLERKATYTARLLPPPGWTVAGQASSLTLEAGASGEITLAAVAPALAESLRRRLVMAEVCIDGVSQGPVAEALVVVGSPA